MADSKLLDRFGRRSTILHEEDGKRYIESRQDNADDIFKAASILADKPPDPETGFRFVCMIPESELNRAFVEGWFHDKEAWRRWAKDRDNRKYNGFREDPFR